MKIKDKIMLGLIEKLVKEAFFEGYDSYETACCSYCSVETAWENSNAKQEIEGLKS